MAVLTAQGIASTTVALLNRMLVLPRTATRIPGGEFSGSNGDTITVRVQQPGQAARTQTAGSSITYDDVDEVPVDVTLAHLYRGKQVADEELDLEIEDFARQILLPITQAVAIGAEDQLATAMNDLTASADIEFAASATSDDTKATILAARERLGDNDVPASGRWAAVAPSIATRLLSVDDFVRVDASGTDTALRQAVIGRLYGFTFVESNALDTDTALFYHQSGFAFANRTPRVPRGAHASATATEQGIGLRTIYQYDPDILSDAVVTSTYAGAAAVADAESPGSGDFPRIVKVGVGTT